MEEDARWATEATSLVQHPPHPAWPCMCIMTRESTRVLQKWFAPLPFQQPPRLNLSHALTALTLTRRPDVACSHAEPEP